MNITRRKIIATVGLSGFALGGTFATGAFTQTQADRDSILVISDDANALLSFEPVDEGLVNVVEGREDNNEIIELEFERDGSGVNVDGVTRFDGVLEVTNNSDNDTIDLVIATPEDGDDRRARSRVLADGKDITKENGFYGDAVDDDDFRFINGVPDDGAYELEDSVTLDFEFETKEATRSGEFIGEKRFKAFDDIDNDASEDVRVDDDLEEEFEDT